MANNPISPGSTKGENLFSPSVIAHAQLIRQLPSNSPQLVFVSEARPWGDWLDRSLTTKGHGGWVGAPSLSPKKASDRGNTHRRDAIKLARLMRSGDLPPVEVPAGEDAAMRDLGRARAEVLRDRKTATVRLTAFLRRHASRSTGQAPWSPAHLRGRSEVVWPTPAQQIVWQEYGHAVTDHPARLERLEPALRDQGPPAARPGSQRPPGPAWCPVPRRRAPGGRPRRPHPL